MKSPRQIIPACIAALDDLPYFKSSCQVVAPFVGGKTVVLVSFYFPFDGYDAAGLSVEYFGALHGAKIKVRNDNLLVFKEFSFCEFRKYRRYV